MEFGSGKIRENLAFGKNGFIKIFFCYYLPKKKLFVYLHPVLSMH